MTWDDDEKSVSASAPIELYTITTPTQVWRIASYHKDVTIGGLTYSAVPASRSNISATPNGTDQEDLNVSLPATHAFVQLFAAQYPPRTVTLLMSRYQQRSGIAMQQWYGFVSGISFKDRTAALRVPTYTSDPLAVPVSSVNVSGSCPHQLYGPRCAPPGGTGPKRSDYTYAGTITSVSADGKTLIVTGGFMPDLNHAVYGDITHVSSTDTRPIVAYSAPPAYPAVVTITLSIPFPRGLLQVGDAVGVAYGCAHVMTGNGYNTGVHDGFSSCIDTFGNQLNYGGLPALPRTNPYYVSITSPGGPA